MQKLADMEQPIEIQDLRKETIKIIILDYLGRHKGKETYPSDIAFAFNLDAKNVFDICMELRKEGKIINRI